MLAFVVTLAVVPGLTIATIAWSKRLAEGLDTLADHRTGWGEKWRLWRGGSSERGAQRSERHAGIPETRDAARIAASTAPASPGSRG